MTQITAGLPAGLRAALAAALMAAAGTLAAQAQQPAKSFVGTISGFRLESAAVEIKPDAGDPVVAQLTADTLAQRIPPGEKDLKKAETIKVTDVAVGDRVLVTMDAGTTNVRRLVVMPAGDIARRNEADRQEWQRRGVAGIVAGKSGGEITVRIRSLAGETEAKVTVGDRTAFKRYAPDSVKFADAKASKLAEVSVGDQLRARGQKSEDGLKVTADDVVFGTFLIKAGAIAAINLEAKEFTIKELGSGKTLVVGLTADSQLKQMPNIPAMTMGGRSGAPSGPGGPATPSGGSGPPMQGGPPAAAGPPGAGGRGMPAKMPGAPGGGIDLSQMLERMPPAKLEDLKPGETIVVSSTRGARNDRLTAIMVLANADTLIQMASAMSAANRGGAAGPDAMGMGMGMGGMMGGSGDAGGLGGLGLSGIIP